MLSHIATFCNRLKEREERGTYTRDLTIRRSCARTYIDAREKKNKCVSAKKSISLGRIRANLDSELQESRALNPRDASSLYVCLSTKCLARVKRFCRRQRYRGSLSRTRLQRYLLRLRPIRGEILASNPIDAFTTDSESTDFTVSTLRSSATELEVITSARFAQSEIIYEDNSQEESLLFLEMRVQDTAAVEKSAE